MMVRPATAATSLPYRAANVGCTARGLATGSQLRTYVLASSIWLFEGPPLHDLMTKVNKRGSASFHGSIVSARGRGDRSANREPGDRNTTLTIDIFNSTQEAGTRVSLPAGGGDCERPRCRRAPHPRRRAGRKGASRLAATTRRNHAVCDPLPHARDICDRQDRSTKRLPSRPLA